MAEQARETIEELRRLMAERDAEERKGHPHLGVRHRSRAEKYVAERNGVLSGILPEAKES